MMPRSRSRRSTRRRTLGVRFRRNRRGRRSFKDLFAGRIAPHHARASSGRCATCRFDVRAGRGDRRRRPQRPGQVDAAQARRRGDARPTRARVDGPRRRRAAHRDHRRLRRRPHGARQRVPHGRPARDVASRDRRALRRDHRLRRDRRLRRHALQAPLERHEGAPRVRGDLAARGADHPRRRGAGGRRQGVPREVLPPHRGAARRRPHPVLRRRTTRGPAALLHARPLPRQGRARARRADRRGARPLQRRLRDAARPGCDPRAVEYGCAWPSRTRSRSPTRSSCAASTACCRCSGPSCWRTSAASAAARRTPRPSRSCAILERRYLAAVTTGGAVVGATRGHPRRRHGRHAGALGRGDGRVPRGDRAVRAVGHRGARHRRRQPRAGARARDDADARQRGHRPRAPVRRAGIGRRHRAQRVLGRDDHQDHAEGASWAPSSTGCENVFIKQFAVRGGAGIIGKAIPFGIGAVIGGAGNHMLGRRVLQQSRLAFGRRPGVLPLELEPRARDGVLQSATSRMHARRAPRSAASPCTTSRGLRTVASRARAASGGRGKAADDAAAASGADVTEAPREVPTARASSRREPARASPTRRRARVSMSQPQVAIVILVSVGLAPSVSASSSSSSNSSTPRRRRAGRRAAPTPP